MNFCVKTNGYWIKHIRVDLYNLPNGRVLFGELTTTTWSGLKAFVPDKYDMILEALVRKIRQWQ